MPTRDGVNRKRPRQPVAKVDQVFTPLGRVTATAPISASLVEPATATDTAIDEINLSKPFDAEKYRSDIRNHGNEEKYLEQLVLTTINDFLPKGKRIQQMTDYTVLTCLAWTVTIHSEIFRTPSVLKSMCSLLKGSNLIKTLRTFPTPNQHGLNATPYTLVCQILWQAYKDQNSWPDEFIEVFVEDSLGEQNWIKNPDCQIFISNIQTAFETRPRTWKLDRSKILPNVPLSASNTQTSVNDETSNDSSTTMSISNEMIVGHGTESDLAILNSDETKSITNSDQKSIIPRYEGRSQSIQNLLQTLLSNNAKLKSTGGPTAISGVQTNSTSLNSTNPSTSQPHETDKLLGLLEQLCGLPDIRLYILSRLDIWLQNPKLTNTAERLMITLCENLTKRTTPNSNGFTNSNNHSDMNYIDTRAIEHLVNLRFKVLISNRISKMYISCIREMLKHDVNLVETIVRSIVHNELQQSSLTLAITSLNSGKNPNNLQLLQACCQAQPELTCQWLADTIQNILLSNGSTTTLKDFENLLRSIRPFLREFMRQAKQEFDAVRFCLYLIDMHYSKNLEKQFWAMMEQPGDLIENEITTHRLTKRLIECDLITRERFLCAICDLIPMMILASAQAFHLQNNLSSGSSSGNRGPSIHNYEQWLTFINRVALIQCSSCLFFLLTVPRLLDWNSPTSSNTYVNCLYSVLFTAQVNSYTRIENWPSEESINFRNELFHLSSEIPLLGETLFLLLQIGLTLQTRVTPSIIVNLIHLSVRRTLTVEQKHSNEMPADYLRLDENQCELFVKKSFELTRYFVPIQVQFPSDYNIPKNLMITDIFWKTCLTCLLLAAHDPQRFGRYIWSSIPQVRLFMEMLLTGDYSYPPKSMIESKQFFEKFLMNERVDLREEKDLILELENYLASPNFIDENNSHLLGKVILFDLEKIKRPSSQEKTEKTFYTHLQGLNNSFKLSSMLCRCRSPDFILQILNRKEKHFDQQTSWLTGLIDSNIDCLNVFPIVCLCDYFQHMIMILKNQKSTSEKTISALDTIRIRFRTIIEKFHAESIDDGELNEIFTYFFDCLKSKVNAMRSNAWLCLSIIFRDDRENFKVEHLSDLVNVEKLLENFDRFPSAKSSLKKTLAEMSQFETNRFLLHSSIVFILENFDYSSEFDENLLGNLLRTLIRRHSIFYPLIQYDKFEKNHQLIGAFFRLISTIFFDRIQQTIDRPVQIISEENFRENSNSKIENFLVFRQFSKKQIEALQEIQSKSILGKITEDKVFLRIDSVFIELLLVFLASVERTNSTIEQLADPLERFLLNENSAPMLMNLKEILVPSPVRTNSNENVEDPTDRTMKSNERKRRLNSTETATKMFASSTNSIVYLPVSINNEFERSLFQSEDLQYFLFKSKNCSLVQKSIDQADLATCLKMFKISGLSRENITYLCQRLNYLIDQSTKQMQIHLKQSSLIVPIINRWIIEKVPNAIQLGEKIQKLLEKKKKIVG